MICDIYIYIYIGASFQRTAWSDNHISPCQCNYLCCVSQESEIPGFDATM